jgi:uncharacterized protein (TIGR03437 family)
MRPVTSLFAPAVLLTLFAALPASGARHFSYLGRTPSGWTSTEVQRSAAATSPAGYTTYIGDAHEYQVARIRTDTAGNTYITGSRQITYSATLGSLSDVFVTKLDVSGDLVFTATIGGKGNDTAADLAVDTQGNLYVAGFTSSTNFPLRNALQTAPGDSFIVKLTPDGSQLLYSTYFGGTESYIGALAVDPAQNIYVGGATSWEGFEATPGLPADSARKGPSGHHPAFATKISASGKQIMYSALIGGSAVGCGCCSSCFLSDSYSGIGALVADPAGSLYFTGSTNVLDLPTTPGAFVGFGGIGGFTGKIRADGTGLEYLTYLSKTHFAQGASANPSTGISSLAVDASGYAYLGGSTWAPDFPVTPGAFQKTYAGPAGPFNASDGFIAKLNLTGTGLAWATYLGGTAEDSVSSLAVDLSGNVWAAGATASAEFPNANGWNPTGSDFLVGLNALGSSLLYSARFPDGSAAQAVAIDPSGMVHAAGRTGLVSTLPPDRPRHVFGIANSAWGPVSGRIAPGELISLYGPGIGPDTPATFQFDSAGLAPKKLGGVEVWIGTLPAPILYVSKNQVNVVVPFGVTGDSARVRVSLSGVAAPEFTAYVDPNAPQIFRNADGSAAAVNEDGTLNSAANPARAGSIVSIWVNGITPAQDVDGALQTGAAYYSCCGIVGPFEDEHVDVPYVGAAPGMITGVAQINFRVPAQTYANFPTVPIAVQDFATLPPRFSDFANVYVK